MEPFELALSQVNFEGNDLTSGPGGQPLHSFSNLVCYDSDFKDGSAGQPVSARRVTIKTDTPGESREARLEAAFFTPYTRVQNGGPHAHAHLVNGSDSVTVEPDETAARLYYKAEDMEDGSLSSGSGGTPRRRPEKVTDSFRGFTETVEALALQKSVIGNSNIAPASAEEVARVIAMAQMKMKGQDSETPPDVSTPQISDSEPQNLVHPSSVRHTECPAASSHTATSVPESYHSELVPGTHGVHAAGLVLDTEPGLLEPDAAAAASRDDAASSVSSSSHQRTASTSSSELIPVPQDMITKVTEKKGWLSGRSVVTPEQSRPKERPASSDSCTNKFSTAEKDLFPPAGPESEELLVQTSVNAEAQIQSVIPTSEQQVLVETGVQEHQSVPDALADISGVEKLKGEYDFDTSSYLQTMQTFTSLPKTNDMLAEESGTARFSPPVKDPGMLPSERRGAQGSRNGKIDRNRVEDITHESLRVLPDENLILPFHVPVDTSTPARPVNGQGDGVQQRTEKNRSSKRQVNLEDADDRPTVRARISRENVNRGSHESHTESSWRHNPKETSTSLIDQDITDHTGSVDEAQPVYNYPTNLPQNFSHVSHNNIENSSMAVNMDDSILSPGRGDDMTGDLSLGNSSAAAGEGADLSKSERADFYRLQEEVVQLRREKAHLEGKMEVLETEASTAIRERSELQSHLASISTHLKSQENNTKSVMGDRNALAADLETLKSNRQRLELVVMDAQKLIEEKDHDLKTLHEDLKLAHAANEKSQEKLKEHRHELMAKDETVQALKNKVAELYVEYQNSQQMRILAENEIKSLESSITSLTSAKEWYQQQLSRSQDAKGELQQEISRIQGESISAVTLVERLKADNVRIKQALAEQQQRALQEKELLARHLEAIESDMMEREAAFSQMQEEQLAMESAMKHEEERLRQAEHEPSFAEDLKKLQNELRRKQAQVNVLDHEQSQLVKRLTLSQENLLERDRTIDRLDQKYVDIELSYKNLQKELDARDEEVLRLKNEKNSLEIELVSTKEEKNTFDVALHTIKDDMGKVEQGFRQLKQELASRTEDLHQVQTRNQNLDRQLAAARARLRITHRSSPQQTAHTNKDAVGPVTYDLAPVHKDIPEDEEGLVVKIVQNQEEGSKPEVVILTQKERIDTDVDENIRGTSIAELDGSIEKVQAENLEVESFHMQHEELARLQTQQQQLEQQLSELQKQNDELKHMVISQDELKQQVFLLNQKLEAAEINCKTAADEKRATENHLVETKERVVEIELELRTLAADKEILENGLREERARQDGEAAADAVEEREAIMQVSKENAMLRSKVTETEKQMNREINKLRGKVLQVTEEYEARLDEERSRQVDYQAAISELNQRLRSAEQGREQLSADLKASEERLNLSLDEQKLQIEEQRQSLGKERESMQKEQHDLRAQLEEVQASLLVREETIEILRTKISEIEVQHREAREQLDESERLRHEEDARHLSLDLEREKGRLAGVVQSHTALKEHATSLEAALARREASVAGLSTHVQGELQKRDKQVHELKEQLKELEAELGKEKQTVKDIKKQLMTEKGQHIKLRRQMETLWVDQDQVKVDLQTRTNQLNLTTLDLEKAKHTTKQLKADVERLTGESQAARRQLEQLRREILEREQQDPMLKEQIQTLEWQLQQRTLEVDALKEQLRLATERQTLEVGSLNKSLQSTTSELAGVKEELMTSRQEKLLLTTKVAQIKAALKATTSNNKKRREQKEAELTKTLPFDMAALERLLVDTAPVAVQSKPLSFLKATLSGLRGEISNLQHQVDQHTSAVQTSSQAWKELEGHVQELREVCKTSAAGRAAATGGPGPGEEDPDPEPAPPHQQPARQAVSTGPPSRTPIVDV